MKYASGRRGHGTIHAVLVCCGLAMAFPFIWQLTMSLSTNQQVVKVPPSFWPGALQWSNYLRAFEQLPLLDQFGNSVAITLLRVAGQVVFCSFGGYAFARMRFRGRAALFAAILSILMIPPQVYLVPQYQIIRELGLLESVLGVALPGMFSAFGTFLMYQYFRSLPVELEEAARLDGASPLQIFGRIMLPLAQPALIALVVTCVLWSWNDLLWPLVITTEAENMPLSAGLATLQGQATPDYSAVMAAATLSTAPIIVLFIILQRRVIDGLALSGTKG